jgi:hypothetical protein
MRRRSRSSVWHSVAPHWRIASTPPPPGVPSRLPQTGAPHLPPRMTLAPPGCGVTGPRARCLSVRAGKWRTWRTSAIVQCTGQERSWRHRAHPPPYTLPCHQWTAVAVWSLRARPVHHRAVDTRPPAQAGPPLRRRDRCWRRRPRRYGNTHGPRPSQLASHATHASAPAARKKPGCRSCGGGACNSFPMPEGGVRCGVQPPLWLANRMHDGSTHTWLNDGERV